MKAWNEWLTAVALALALGAHGATFYVNGATGDDRRSATLAQDPSTP
jgi:hypothetical protein